VGDSPMSDVTCTHPEEFRVQREVEVGRETRPATREMALDAGDADLEGIEVDCGPVLGLLEFCSNCGEEINSSE